jgi:copper transport protein
MRLRLFTAGLATALATALAGAATAAAHSQLVATEPARDAVVADPPERVLLRFDEPVEAALGSLTVYDGAGRRVDAERISRPRSSEVVVAIDRELARGTYTVGWRVISADSDPISGAFVFHVGAPGPQPRGVAAQVLEDTPFTVSAAYLAGRFADFVLLLLCVGGAAALVFALDAAAPALRRRLLKLLAAVAAALAAVALVGLVLQGAAAAGTGLGDAVRLSVVEAVAGTRFGRFSLLRAGLAAALAALALRARARGGRTDAPALLLVCAGLVVTPGLSGHASVTGAGAIVADAAHVQAAAVWTGGLAFVVLALSSAGRDRWELAASAVPRFSTTAVASVAVLLVAGAVNGYLQVRAWRGLWETEYGVLLLVKIGLVLPLLALGAYNNRYAVPRLRAQVASPGQRTRFLHLAGAELALMATVVGVTAALVNAPPARTAATMEEPFTTEVRVGPGRAHVEVMPARPGPNEIHLRFVAPPGVRLTALRLQATLPSRDLGPLRFDADRGTEPGAFAVERAVLPFAGDWQLRLEAEVGRFDLHVATVSVSIEDE